MPTLPEMEKNGLLVGVSLVHELCFGRIKSPPSRLSSKVHH